MRVPASLQRWSTPHRAALRAIVGWFVACEVLIWPVADVPMVDDWTYAFSVERLLHTGRLEILPISAVYPVTQIVWGALFSLPTGFSFTALRLSTLALACAGAWALFLTLRDLGVSQSRALLGTFSVVCNPVSLFLANSFMTDVPLMSLSCCAAFAYVRGFTRRDAAWLWAAAPVCVAAVLVRQVAVVVPAAALAASLCTRDRELRRLAAPASFAACALALSAWAVVGELLPIVQQSERLDRVQYLFDVGLSGYALLTVDMILVLTFMLFPLGLAGLGALRLRSAAGAAVASSLVLLSACIAFFASGAFDPLHPDHATLTHYELGGARNLLAGAPEPASYWPALGAAVRMLIYLSLGALVIAIALAVRRGIANLARVPIRFVVAWGGLQIGLVSVLWLYSDRYYLALLPALVLVLLTVLHASRLSMPLAAAGLVLQTAIGVLGTRDALHYNETCARAYADLVRTGVPPYDIDAGWSFNGWMLYAHDENLPRDLDRERDVPAVTSKRERPYLFAKSKVPGYEPVRHIRWEATVWPWPNELYVLRKERLARR